VGPASGTGASSTPVLHPTRPVVPPGGSPFFPGEIYGLCTQLGRWRAGVEKVGDGGHKLGGRERLGQHDAVGNAFGGPISGAGAAHVDDGKLRVDLPGLLATSQPSILPRRVISVTSAR